MAGGKAVAGRDGAVGRRRHPGHAVARPGPARAPARAPGRRVRRGARIQASRAGTSTWSPRAGCRAAELETANARLADAAGRRPRRRPREAHAPARHAQPQGWTAGALVPRGGLRPARAGARRRVGRGRAA